MNLESFMDLVHKNNGFEFVIGYKDFIDHRIGGQDNKYWYYIDYDGKKQEYNKTNTYNATIKGGNIKSLSMINPNTNSIYSCTKK